MFLFVFILSLWSHCLSLSLSPSLPLLHSLSISLSQPTNQTHYRTLATTITTTTIMIRDPHQSSWWPTSMRLIKSTIHTGQLDDPCQSRRWSTSVDPRTQTHKPRPIKSPEHIVGAHQTMTHDPRPSLEHNHWQSTLIGEPQQRSTEREESKGKRKIEERAIEVNKKEFFFYNPATVQSHM